MNVGCFPFQKLLCFFYHIFLEKSRPDAAGHGEFILTVNPSISEPQSRQIILPRRSRRTRRSLFFVFFVTFVVLKNLINVRSTDISHNLLNLYYNYLRMK